MLLRVDILLQLPPTPELLKLMRAFCPRLSDVSVDVREPEHSGYADLLCSYGRNLQFLDVQPLSAELRGQIVGECPNLKCDDRYASCPKISALGTSLRKLVMVSGDEVDMGLLGLALQACSELEEIKFEEFSAYDAADAVRALFKIGKSFLSSFSLSMLQKSIYG